MENSLNHAAQNDCPLCGAAKAAHRLVCVECAPVLYRVEQQDLDRKTIAVAGAASHAPASALPSAICVAGFLVFFLGLVTTQFWRWPDRLAEASVPPRMALAPSGLYQTTLGPSRPSLAPTRLIMPLSPSAYSKTARNTPRPNVLD